MKRMIQRLLPVASKSLLALSLCTVACDDATDDEAVDDGPAVEEWDEEAFDEEEIEFRARPVWSCTCGLFEDGGSTPTTTISGDYTDAGAYRAKDRCINRGVTATFLCEWIHYA